MFDVAELLVILKLEFSRGLRRERFNILHTVLYSLFGHIGR